MKGFPIKAREEKVMTERQIKALMIRERQKEIEVQLEILSVFKNLSKDLARVLKQS